MCSSRILAYSVSLSYLKFVKSLEACNDFYVLFSQTYWEYHQLLAGIMSAALVLLFLTFAKVASFGFFTGWTFGACAFPFVWWSLWRRKNLEETVESPLNWTFSGLLQFFNAWSNPLLTNKWKFSSIILLQIGTSILISVGC